MWPFSLLFAGNDSNDEPRNPSKGEKFNVRRAIVTVKHLDEAEGESGSREQKTSVVELVGRAIHFWDSSPGNVIRYDAAKAFEDWLENGRTGFVRVGRDTYVPRESVTKISVKYVDHFVEARWEK